MKKTKSMKVQGIPTSVKANDKCFNEDTQYKCKSIKT
jgi:hypothetical protein